MRAYTLRHSGVMALSHTQFLGTAMKGGSGFLVGRILNPLGWRWKVAVITFVKYVKMMASADQILIVVQ